jgi:hypothetical protein
MDARTVLARKGSLRRAKSRRALAHRAPFRRINRATGGSGGWAKGSLFFDRGKENANSANLRQNINYQGGQIRVSKWAIPE